MQQIDVLIDIALATFNGEKYLSEQLDSLINQSYKNWRVLISDDGSSDRTIDIINEYCKLDKRFLLVNTKRQGGVIKNFEKALSFSSAKYIMFCDQDDVWLPNKIACSYQFIKKQENNDQNTPILVFSDLTIVDKNLNIIASSFYTYNNIKYSNNLNKWVLPWTSSIYGCSTIFNRSLLNQALPIFTYASMHDQWFGIIAATKGRVCFNNSPLLLYRQHDNNVVGGTKKNLFGKFLHIKPLLKKIRTASNNTKKILKNLHGESSTTYINRLNYSTRYILPHIKQKPSYTIIFVICYLFW